MCIRDRCIRLRVGTGGLWGAGTSSQAFFQSSSRDMKHPNQRFSMLGVVLARTLNCWINLETPKVSTFLWTLLNFAGSAALSACARVQPRTFPMRTGHSIWLPDSMSVSYTHLTLPTSDLV